MGGQGKRRAVGIQAVYWGEVADGANQGPAGRIGAIVAIDGAIVGVGGCDDYNRQGAQLAQEDQIMFLASISQECF